MSKIKSTIFFLQKKTLKSIVQGLEGGTAECNSGEKLNLYNYGKGMQDDRRKCKTESLSLGSLLVES